MSAHPLGPVPDGPADVAGLAGDAGPRLRDRAQTWAERQVRVARSSLQRRGLARWLGWLEDPYVVVGAVLLGVGASLWTIDRTMLERIGWPLDAPIVLGGAALMAGRLGARRVRQQTDHLAVLQAASARMSRATTVEAVGRAIVEETGRILDYHNARVYVLEAPDQVVPIAFEGTVGAYEKVDFDLLRCAVGEGFTGWVAQHGVPLLVGDADRDPRGATIPGTDEVDESMVVVPMRYDERIVGVITLSKLGLNQFDAADLRLLSILADQAATALETASLLARSQDLATELRRLVDMGSALSQSLDPRQVAELIGRHLVGALHVDECAISVWERETDRVRTVGYEPPGTAPEDDSFDLGRYPATRRVLTLGQHLVIHADDPAADPAEVEYLERNGFRTLVMLPLLAKGQAIGLAELYARSRVEMNAATIDLARTMASEAAMALDNAQLYERARQLADRDPLTGFFNHRFLHERLAEELLRASRTRQPVSVLMLDLDRFKVVNDTFGHQLGDQVLVWTAELIRATLRGSDVPARYGGDEFAVILPDTDRDAALAVAERILDALRARSFQAEGRGPVPIGVSIGVASYPLDGATPTTLIGAADTAMFHVKGDGGHGLEAA